jgi:endonuclease YncB( thermonuclease family)
MVFTRNSRFLSVVSAVTLPLVICQQAHAGILDRLKDAIKILNHEPVVTLIGRGCPSGTVNGVMNGDTLSITFNQFDIYAQPGDTELKECWVNISYLIPEGKIVKPMMVSYSGGAGVSSTGTADLTTLIGYNENIQPIENLNFPADYSDTFVSNIPLQMESVEACSQSQRFQTINIASIITAHGGDTSEAWGSQLAVFTQNSGENPDLTLQFSYTDCE